MSPLSPTSFQRLPFALERLQFVRKYTLPLLDALQPADWFTQPAEGTSHIAWQVGHMAVAQHHMALIYVRGEQPHDAGLVPPEFRALFGRGSVPEPDRARYPSPEELRAVLDRVHAQIPQDLEHLPDGDLDQPTTKPHPAFKTKFQALVFCAEHEMVHAGQIGLLRRMLGHAPLR